MDKIHISLKENDKINVNLNDQFYSIKNTQNKEVIPTWEVQVITADTGYDALEQVTVNGVTNEVDSNITPENIRKDISILGVTGEIEELKATELTIAPSTEEQIINPTEPNNSFSKVIVNKVTNDIDNNITPDNIKAGVSILGVDGTIEELNATEVSIVPTDTEQVVTPEAPYNAFNKVTVGASSGGDLSEYFDLDISGDTTQSYLMYKAILKFPMINTTGCTQMNYAFQAFSSLKTIPLVDTSSVTSMNNMFTNCYSLEEIPLLNTSSVRQMNYMFSYCEKLKTIPLINTASVTTMRYMFSNCRVLESVPFLNTSSVTNMERMFENCYVLKEIPQFDTSNVTSMNNMFYNTTNIERIPELDGSKLTNVSNMFSNTKAKFTEFGGLKNLGEAYLTTASASYSNYTLTLTSAPNLTHDSLMNVINNLYDIKTKGCKTQKLVLGTTLKNKLTSDELAIAENKGWVVS